MIRDIGEALWMIGCVLMGSLVAQLFIHNQPKFGVLALVTGALLLVGAPMKDSE